MHTCCFAVCCSDAGRTPLESCNVTREIGKHKMFICVNMLTKTQSSLSNLNCVTVVGWSVEKKRKCEMFLLAANGKRENTTLVVTMLNTFGSRDNTLTINETYAI